MQSQRLVGLAAILIEPAKEFQKLQAHVVDIAAQQVQRQIQRITDEGDDDEEDPYYNAVNYFEFPNNQKAVAKLIEDGKGPMEKLGGQNPLPVYDKVAKGVSIDYVIANDDYFFRFLEHARREYMKGDLTNIFECVNYIYLSFV